MFGNTMSLGLREPNTNDPIREFQARMQDISQEAERLRPVLKACRDAVQRSGAKVGIGVGNKNQLRPQVELMMGCGSLDETIPLFRELAKEGIHTDKKETYKDQKILDVFPVRQYNLGPSVSLIVMLIGSSKDGTGKSCRMEQVGVKEVPVYEVKCD